MNQHFLLWHIICMEVFYLEVVDFNRFIKSYLIACFQPLGFSEALAFYIERSLPLTPTLLRCPFSLATRYRYWDKRHARLDPYSLLDFLHVINGFACPDNSCLYSVSYVYAKAHCTACPNVCGYSSNPW